MMNSNWLSGYKNSRNFVLCILHTRILHCNVSVLLDCIPFIDIEFSKASVPTLVADYGFSLFEIGRYIVKKFGKNIK